MTLNYRQITPEIARQIRLVMTDVDGTLTDEDGTPSQAAHNEVCRLERYGISVGLVSGRHMSKLESMANQLEISGPIIAENGGVAKLKSGGDVLDLGYSRQPALKALARLKKYFPEYIREREDNAERSIDIVFFADELNQAALQKHLQNVQYYDSGYVLHIMEKGISKGRTLQRLLDEFGYRGLSPAETFVIGDSPTDISLFEYFSHGVAVPNPKLTDEQRQLTLNCARYASTLTCGDGFTEVMRYIIATRNDGHRPHR